MKRTRLSITLALIAVLFTVTGSQALEHRREKYVDVEVFSFINNAWSVQERFIAAVKETNEKDTDVAVVLWQDAICDHINQAEALVEWVLADNTRFNEFCSIYGNLSTEHRELLTPVIDQFVERGTDPTNFPGYGYPDPDYVYRKGRELERIFLSAYWRTENKTLEQSKHVETSMELSVAAGWGQQNTANGNIENFKIGSTSNINIDGEMKTMCKVTFTTKTTLITECIVKFQRTKVWYELFHAKKGFLGMWQGDWALCGKTYEVAEEETGEQVINRLVKSM